MNAPMIPPTASLGSSVRTQLGDFECLACPEGYRNADGLDANDCEFPDRRVCRGLGELLRKRHVHR